MQQVSKLFEAARSSASPSEQWRFDRSQAAIDVHDSKLPPGWDQKDEEGNPIVELTADQKSIVQARAVELGIQWAVLDNVVVPETGPNLTVEAYGNFEAQYPRPPEPEEP